MNRKLQLRQNIHDGAEDAPIMNRVSAGSRFSVFAALAAAMLFGISTPFAKTLLGDVTPLLLAGLLYLGIGLGLSIIRLLRDRGWSPPGLRSGEWPWLLAAVGFGGILGPALLMFGLLQTSAASASLLLNLEAVFTAAIAWLVFRENVDKRIALGMLAIVVGAVILSWSSRGFGTSGIAGTLAVAAACLCWASITT
jgi:EamA-like transporter family.